jgi:hypothetical protein
MPEEATTAPAEVQDTPSPAETPEAQDTSTTGQEDSYRPRYENLQSEFTRKSQEASEYRQRAEAFEALLSDDAEARQKAAETLGYELPEAEPEEYLDPVDELRAEIESLRNERKAEKEAQTRSQQEEVVIDHVDSQLEAIERSEKVTFSDEEQAAIVALAMSKPNDAGLPDVQAAYKWMTGWATDKAGDLAARKRAAQAPQGEVRDREIDMSNRQARIAATEAAVERHMASQ